MLKDNLNNMENGWNIMTWKTTGKLNGFQANSNWDECPATKSSINTSSSFGPTALSARIVLKCFSSSKWLLGSNQRHNNNLGVCENSFDINKALKLNIATALQNAGNCT